MKTSEISFYDFAVTKLRFYKKNIAGELGVWIYENSKYNAPELRVLNRTQWRAYLHLTGHDSYSFKAFRAAWCMYEARAK